MGQQIEIDGIAYLIEKVNHFEVNGKQRKELFLRRPKGRRVYVAVVYENGAMSGIA